jgi:hypothetical protein
MSYAGKFGEKLRQYKSKRNYLPSCSALNAWSEDKNRDYFFFVYKVQFIVDAKS